MERASAMFSQSVSVSKGLKSRRRKPGCSLRKRFRAFSLSLVMTHQVTGMEPPVTRILLQ